MELRHLRYFIAVAEEENITRAAVRLRVAQPSLSRQIRSLEEEIGVALLDHGPRKIRLTDAGRLFLGHAREAVEKISEAVRTVREFASAGSGELRVGYAPSLTTKILPHALRNFQIQHSTVRVKLHDLSTEEMLAGLHDDTLDIALLIKPSQHALNGLRYDEIIRFRPCVALSPSHPLARQEHLALREIAKETILAYCRADYPEYHVWLEQLFKGNELPRAAAEYDSSTSLIAAVESGCGIALVQEGFEHLAGARLVLRPLSDADDTSFSFGAASRQLDTSPLIPAFKSGLSSPNASGPCVTG